MSEYVDSRSMPAAVNVEAELLAALLCDPRQLDEVVGVADPSDCYSSQHATVWRAMHEVVDRTGGLDAPALIEHLRETRRSGDDWAAVVVRLLDRIGLSQSARQYAQIIASKAQRRALIESARDIADLVHTWDGGDAELVDACEGALYGSVRVRHGRRRKPIREIARDVLLEIERGREHGIVPGLSTGFASLDSVFRLRRGELTIVGGRPGMGKTAWAVNGCGLRAARTGSVVAVQSCEMPREQLVERMVSQMARVPLSAVRDCRMSEDQFAAVAGALQAIGSLPLAIDDTPSQTVEGFAGFLRRVRREHGRLDLAVFDHMQIAGGPGSDLRHRVTAVSGGLKAVAKELEVPVVALCQLSRAVEERPDKMPRLADLRESGSIEQDADVVLMLMRPPYYWPNGEAGAPPAEVAAAGGVEATPEHARWRVVKNRSGSLGEGDLRWLGRFTEYAE